MVFLNAFEENIDKEAPHMFDRDHSRIWREKYKLAHSRKDYVYFCWTTYAYWDIKYLVAVLVYKDHRCVQVNTVILLAKVAFSRSHNRNIYCFSDNKAPFLNYKAGSYFNSHKEGLLEGKATWDCT